MLNLLFEQNMLPESIIKQFAEKTLSHFNSKALIEDARQWKLANDLVKQHHEQLITEDEEQRNEFHNKKIMKLNNDNDNMNMNDNNHHQHQEHATPTELIKQ